MKKLSGIIKKLTSQRKYCDELFYNNNQFFIIYEHKICYRDDPGYSIDGIYKISEKTNKFINQYLKKSKLELNDFDLETLSIYLDDSCYDNERFTEIIESNDEDEELLADDTLIHLIQSCINSGIESTAVLRAIIMLQQECEAEIWYMDFGGEYSSVSDGVAEAGEIIDCEDDNAEYEIIENEWLEVIENIDDYVYDDGLLL